MKAKKFLSALIAGTMALSVTAFAAVENEPKYSTSKLTEMSFTANTYEKLDPNLNLTEHKVELDFGMVFSVDENAAKDSPYKEYNADFEITFNKNIYSGDIGLYGNYGEYGWLGTTLTDPENENALLIEADVPVRIVTLFDRTMTFSEICSIVKEFKCGVAIVDEENMSDLKASLDLRLYETYRDADNNNQITETGNSFVVGSTYEFSADNTPVWMYDTDAGYVTDGTGVMRFLFSADITDVAETGVKFMTANLDNVDPAGAKTSTTAGSTFYADVTGVPKDTTGTYYAKAYVKTSDGKIYWSNALACSPNFSKLIAE